MIRTGFASLITIALTTSAVAAPHSAQPLRLGLPQAAGATAFDMLQEYNAPSYKIGRGSFVGSFEDTNLNPGSVMQIDPEQ